MIDTSVKPPHSVVLVEDETGGTIPASMGGEIVAQTESCIAIGCRSASDGHTEVRLGRAAEVAPGWQPAFEGELLTPSKLVIVRSVLGERYLEITTSRGRAFVRIWVNDPSEPDELRIGVD